MNDKKLRLLQQIISIEPRKSLSNRKFGVFIKPPLHLKRPHSNIFALLILVHCLPPYRLSDSCIKINVCLVVPIRDRLMGLIRMFLL